MTNDRCSSSSRAVKLFMGGEGAEVGNSLLSVKTI